MCCKDVYTTETDNVAWSLSLSLDSFLSKKKKKKKKPLNNNQYPQLVLISQTHYCLLEM